MIQVISPYTYIHTQWTTQEGEVLYVGDMKNRHLSNTYYLLHNRGARGIFENMLREDQADRMNTAVRHVPGDIRRKVTAIEIEMFRRGMFTK